MALRQVMNTNNPNQLSDALKDLPLGELLTFLIKGATPTQTGVVPSSNVATLAAVATGMFQVNATTATVTGIKTLLRGKISGTGALVPATGECVWDGANKLLFAAADAVTAVSATYSVAADKASVLEGAL